MDKTIRECSKIKGLNEMYQWHRWQCEVYGNGHLYITEDGNIIYIRKNDWIPNLKYTNLSKIYMQWLVDNDCNMSFATFRQFCEETTIADCFNDIY